MAMGMSRDEYWNGDIFAAFDYAEAEHIRAEKYNSEAWLSGNYTYAAVGIALHNYFSKPGVKKQEYPDKPFEIFQNDNEQKKLDDETDALRARLIMESIVNKFSYLGGD